MESRDGDGWIADNFILYDELFMLRRGSDSTPDTVLKKEWLDSFGKDNIIFVVDDRQRVVDMWRASGVVCLQCDTWPEYKRQ
jgi:hypothetical protein